MQPHHAMGHPPSLVLNLIFVLAHHRLRLAQSIVNQNGNITYNLGRDVVNNNKVYNYIFAYEAARHTSRLEQHVSMRNCIATMSRSSRSRKRPRKLSRKVTASSSNFGETLNMLSAWR